MNEHGRQALFELPAYGGANCAVKADFCFADAASALDAIALAVS